MTPLAGAMLFAAMLLTLDGLRARRRIETLESEAERREDVLWDIRESEERIRSLIDGQGDLIVRRDPRGRITFVNEAFCRLAGRSRETLVGSAFRLPVVETGTREARDGAVARRDEAVETVEGVRWIEWQDVAVRGPIRGRPEMQSVGRDVTARRQAERAAAQARDAAEAANQAKSRFLATVTHEIRTPLGGILGMADLLLDTPLAPDQVTYAKAVKVSGETLLSLIDEILDLSKIEAGHLDLDEKPFDLIALIEDVVELLAPRAHAKGLEIAAHVGSGISRRIFGDGVRLKQVMLNLAGNAVKFTQAGGVAIHLAPEAGRIAFAVADTGIGIDPEQIPVIFREFEQADATPARRYGGTGLGLAISQRIVERMGGRLAVDSELGRGSTFHFTLPLPAAADQLREHAALPRGRRVLVASPSPIVGPTLAAMLTDLAMESMVESDLDAAMALIEEGSFDTALVDRGFGLKAVMAMAAKGAGGETRIIALVTPAERHDLDLLMVSGASGYLIKPVRSSSLIAQVARAPRPMPANDDAEASVPLTGVSVLLAEDNDVNALVARTVLARLGASVEWARNGGEAVAAHAAGRFDAVLMDMHMPGLDGAAATRAIRAAEEVAGASRTPVYALTANMREEDRAACLAAGMDDFLTKPLNRDDLVALLTLPRQPAKSA
jgi:PAS domain S-box-containing protein